MARHLAKRRNPRWDRWCLVLSLLVAAVAASGCVSHRMYRGTAVVEHPGYTLAFIEFDDQGEVWSPRQFYQLQDLIRTANQNESGAVVVLLAHGWNNDASPRNEVKGTLAGFKETLERVSRTVHATTPDKPVVGVYLGWRGKSLRGPWRSSRDSRPPTLSSRPACIS